MAEPARAELGRWRDDLLAGRDDLRPVAPEALHLTLVFLGRQDEEDVERIAAALAPAPRPRLVPLGVEPVPPRGPPRLIALDLEDAEGRAGAIQAAVSGALEAERLFKPEKRPFWPHVTLARVKRGRRAAPLEAGSLPPPIEADRLTLYRSTLRPQGAVYDPLASLPLS